MAKLTDRKIDQLCKVLKRTSGNVKASCAAVGISTVIFYKWKQKVKKLAAAFEDARHECNLEAENMLYENMRKGNQRAIEFILTNQMPDKWKHISKIQMENAENELEGLTNEELLKGMIKMSKEMGVDVKELLDFEDVEESDYEILDDSENLLGTGDE